MQRPSIGSIAVGCDWLLPENIIDILRERRYGEKFGECALRRGYISQYKLVMLLDRQRAIQPQIGKYFIEEGIITSLQLNRLIADMKKHNRKFWSY
jgi:hypothetical protein